MVKKIKNFLILLLLALFITSNSFADNHMVVELDSASSGGAKFVKIPKNAARDFLKEKGLDPILVKSEEEAKNFDIESNKGKYWNK